jgi:hypothetical protein
MPPKKRAKNNARGNQSVLRDKVGDLFADIPSVTGEGVLRVSFRRHWYTPPFRDDGEVDYETAATELADELSGGTIVLRNYLENGKLGYATEVNVDTKDELEVVLRTIRKVYMEGLKQDNATREAALAQCRVRLTEPQRPVPQEGERRKMCERRKGERRERVRFGRALFRRRDRRIEADRRGGMERRAKPAQPAVT